MKLFKKEPAAAAASATDLFKAARSASGASAHTASNTAPGDALSPAAEERKAAFSLFKRKASDGSVVNPRAPSRDVTDIEDVVELAPTTPAAPLPVAKQALGLKQSLARFLPQKALKSRSGEGTFAASSLAEPSLSAEPRDPRLEDLLDDAGMPDVPPTAVQTAPTSPTKSWKFGKAAKPAKAAPEKAATPPKAKKEPRKPSLGKQASARSITLYTELSEGTSLWWELTAAGLKRVDEAQVHDAFSFSPADYRFAAPKKMGYGAASNLALAEVSEYCSIVNASGGAFGAVHATLRERAQDRPWSIRPGMALLDQLLRAKLSTHAASDDLAAPDTVVGARLADASGDNSLVILYKLTGDHQLTNLQISVNAEDLDFLLQQYAQSARVNTEDAPVVLFTAEELLSVAGMVPAFANEAVWQGYPVRKLLTTGLVASAAAAVGATAFLGYQYNEQRGLQTRKAKLEHAIRKADQSAAELLSGAVRSFAAKSSLNERALFDTAQRVWQPGTVVTMTSDYSAGTTRYELRMKLPQAQGPNNRPSVALALSPERLAQLVDFTAPDACTREGTYISGNLNEVQIIVNCQVPASPVARYRLD